MTKRDDGCTCPSYCVGSACPIHGLPITEWFNEKSEEPMTKRDDEVNQNIANERERLGRMVRSLWVEWAERQPSPKASWLVPWEQLGEQDKEADRCIGYGLFCEFTAEVCGSVMAVRHLVELANELRGQLDAFRDCYDESDPASGDLIRRYDEFIANFDPGLLRNNQ